MQMPLVVAIIPFTHNYSIKFPYGTACTYIRTHACLQTVQSIVYEYYDMCVCALVLIAVLAYRILMIWVPMYVKA